MVRLVTDFVVSSLKYIDHFGGGTHGQIDRTTEEPSLHVSSPETVPASRLYPGWITTPRRKTVMSLPAAAYHNTGWATFHCGL